MARADENTPLVVVNENGVEAGRRPAAKLWGLIVVLVVIGTVMVYGASFVSKQPSFPLDRMEGFVLGYYDHEPVDRFCFINDWYKGPSLYKRYINMKFFVELYVDGELETRSIETGYFGPSEKCLDLRGASSLDEGSRSRVWLEQWYTDGSKHKKGSTYTLNFLMSNQATQKFEYDASGGFLHYEIIGRCTKTVCHFCCTEDRPSA